MHIHTVFVQDLLAALNEVAPKYGVLVSAAEDNAEEEGKVQTKTRDKSKSKDKDRDQSEAKKRDKDKGKEKESPPTYFFAQELVSYLLALLAYLEALELFLIL